MWQYFVVYFFQRGLRKAVGHNLTSLSFIDFFYILFIFHQSCRRNLTYILAYLSTFLPFHQTTCEFLYLPTCLLIYLSTCVPLNMTNFLYVFLSLVYQCTSHLCINISNNHITPQNIFLFSATPKWLALPS